jgi:hypothetical protein
MAHEVSSLSGQPDPNMDTIIRELVESSEVAPGIGDELREQHSNGTLSKEVRAILIKEYEKRPGNPESYSRRRCSG